MTPNVPLPGTELCSVDALTDGRGRTFTWGSGKDAFSVIVLRAGDAVNAYVNSCPHFGIPLDYQTRVTTFRSEFVLCSHHYAAFRFSDGHCVEGPCEGAELTRMPIEIVDGRVRIAPFDAPSM